MKLDTIFVIIDPSRQAQPALERGIDSAQETGATLHLYACDTSPGQERTLAPAMEELAQYARGKNLTVESETDQGDDWPNRAVQAATRCRASVIFKDSIGHSAVDREKRLTSDWTLLRGSPCPVLLVKDFRNWRKRRVLAAVNPGSPEATHRQLDSAIIAFANNLARSYRSEAHFVLAFHDLNHPPDSSAVARACDTTTEQIHIRRGAPEQVIRDVARELEVDLVIIGTVGRAGIKGRVVGNTSERLLDQTEADLLVLK